jgi:hypothetical protein
MYANGVQSDMQGRVTFPVLVPDAGYRMLVRTAAFGGGDLAIGREFTLKPGEALDVGDILIAMPRRRN